MSFFKMLKYAAQNKVGISVLQNGSDILINRHTNIDTFTINSALRKHANEVIKHLYMRGFMEDMCEEEAALIKLAEFYKSAEQFNEQYMMGLCGDAISKIRSIAQGKIRAEISLRVMSETGY